MDADLNRQLKVRRVRSQRSGLVSALLGCSNVEEYLDAIVSLQINLSAKLQALDLPKLLALNCQNSEDVRHLVVAMKSVGSFGRQLCASGSLSIPDTERVITKATSPLWKSLAPLKHPETLLTPLGYTLTPTDLRLPQSAAVTMTTVAGVTADVLVAGDELERFLSGSHIDCQQVDVFSPNLRAAIEADGQDYQNVGFLPQITQPKPEPTPRQKSKPVVAKKPPSDIQVTMAASPVPTGDSGCDLCGKNVTQQCVECQGKHDNWQYCGGCDQSWHNHVKRRSHTRVSVTDTRQTRTQMDQRNPATSRNRTQTPASSVQTGSTPSALLRPNGDHTRQGRGSRCASVVVIPGKRTTEIYELETAVADEGGDAVYSKPTPQPHRSHPPLKPQPNLTQRPDALLDKQALPDFSQVLGKSVASSNDSESEEDVYENVASKDTWSTGTSEAVLAGIRSITAELDAESDLHRRRVKVDSRLEDVGHRLTSIVSGLESVSVADRISLYREQEFLESYRDDLVRKIARDAHKQLIKSQPPKVTRMNQSLDQKIMSSQQKEDDIYKYSSELPVPKETSTYPRRSRLSDSKSLPFMLLEQAAVSSNTPSRQSMAYEDIQAADIDTVHTFPARSPRSPVKKVMSEPGSGWPSPWECQHCTLHNLPGTRVCAACSRTSDTPKLFSDPASSLTRPLPSLPPDAPPLALVGKSAETCTLLKRLVALQRRHSSGVDAALTDSELLQRLEAAFQEPGSGLSYPLISSPDDRLKSSGAQQLEAASRQLLYQLKEAECAGFSCDEFELAMSLGKGRPLHWLQTEWGVQVDRVVAKATKELRELHKQARLSRLEARQALVDSGCDVEVAASEAASKWRTAYQELVANLALDGLASRRQRDDVTAALTCSQGDISAASVSLFRRWRASAVLERVWATGSEVYGNDEVMQTLPGRLGPDKPYQKVSDMTLDLERRLRMLMAEFDLDSREKAHNVVRLWDHRDQLPETVSIGDVIEAVKNCGNTTRALSYLNQKCAVCEDKFPAGKIQLLSFCQCRLCVGCLKEYFSLRIKENQVRDLVCPICRQPNIENREQFEQHIQLLVLMLRHHLSLDVVELFEKKLRDWSLMQDCNFRWCSYDDCGCGFVFAPHFPGELRMECPECQRPTCFHCKKPWEAEHNNRTCDQFDTWKLNNFPTGDQRRQSGLLQDSSIDCPRCRSRYAVSRGGCLHFTCSQCGHEFCSGCSRPFHRGSLCPERLPMCAQSGLHSHHPRSCLYYLGGESVDRLQTILQVANVAYQSASPSGTGNRSSCSVLIHTDSAGEQACGKQVAKLNAGLCELHYKEYLVGLINEHNLDPLPLLSLDELKNQFFRVGRDVPAQQRGEKLDVYKQRLRMVIEEEIPLPKFGKPVSMTT